MPGKRGKKGKRSALPVKKTKKSGKRRASSGTRISSRSLKTLRESQRQLRIILDAAHMGIWEWDMRTDRVTWSGGVFGLSRLDRKSFANSYEEYMKLVPADDRDIIYYALKNALNNQKNYHIEHRIIWHDGTIRWLEAFGNVLYDRKGKPVKLSGTVQDITQKKAGEAERKDWKTRFELISASAGLVIYDHDIPSGQIIFSGSSLKALGYTPEEMSALSREALIHPDDRRKTLLALEDARRRLISYDLHYRFRKKDGQYCFMHDRGFYIANLQGETIRILGVMADVTEQNKYQESLRESETRFRRLQEASFGGIGLHDKGVILDCNQGLCDLTGYSQNELIGSNGVQLLIAPEYRDMVIDNIRSGYDKPYDAEGIRKDGTRYMLEIRGKNLPYEGRTIRIAEFRDVTDRKQAEERMMTQNARMLAVTEQLRRKNRQLEEFTQIVSHNLRSPVGNILTLLNFYELAVSEEERTEYFNLLKESAGTTLTMLNELNDILKVKQHQNIEKQELKFESVLRQVMSMLTARITALGAKVEYDFSAAPALLYPAIYLESILLNLLDNALKYHSPRRPPEIAFRTYVNDQGNTLLEVKDNGLGINLERFGHQVFKLRKTFHLHPESRGIGLFMIKNQIEAMGGEITISSREHEGTTFFVNFHKHQLDGA